MEIQFTYYEVEAARGPMHEEKKILLSKWMKRSRKIQPQETCNIWHRGTTVEYRSDGFSAGGKKRFSRLQSETLTVKNVKIVKSCWANQYRTKSCLIRIIDNQIIKIFRLLFALKLPKNSARRWLAWKLKNHVNNFNTRNCTPGGTGS